jgi:hypothetical protein
MNPRPNSLPTTEIAIAWSGLPPYAIACVGAFARQTGRRVHLIGTAPDTPYEAIEPPPGVTISWIDPHDDALRWGRFGSAAPACFVASGWATPAFNALSRDTQKCGGSVVLMMDNRWRGWYFARGTAGCFTPRSYRDGRHANMRSDLAFIPIRFSPDCMGPIPPCSLPGRRSRSGRSGFFTSDGSTVAKASQS